MDNPMLNLNNNEIWEEVTRLHEVSHNGGIRNIHSGVELTPHVGSTGYKYVTIRNHEGKARKHLKVHILVAKAFIPNSSNLPEVNHKDGNKLNNAVSNLEWVTHHQNMTHAGETGLISKKPRTTGVKLGRSSRFRNVTFDQLRGKWVAAITHNKRSVGSKRFDTEEEAAEHVNYLIDSLGLSRPKNVIQ